MTASERAKADDLLARLDSFLDRIAAMTDRLMAKLDDQEEATDAGK